MAEESAPPLLSPEHRRRIAELLGGECWCAKVEQIMVKRRDFLKEGQPRPAVELSAELAD